MNFEYDKPIIHDRRTGRPDDPFVSKNETHIVNNDGIVILTEIPNKFDRVAIFGDNREWIEISKGVPNLNEYKVDYNSRHVTLNKEHIGKQLDFEYMGTGLSFINVDGVYTKSNNGKVTETLKSLVDTTDQAKQDAIDATQATEQATQDAITATENTNQAIDNANTLVDETKYIEPYNTNTTYQKNNVVSFNGAAFMAKQTTQGNNPPDPTVSEGNEFWGLLSRKGNDGNGTVATHRDSFIATEGQRTFNLSHTYDQFQDRTSVYVGGVPQKYPDNYEETTSTSITLSEGVPAGTEVIIKYFGESVPLESDIQTTVDNHTTTISDHASRLNNNENELTNVNEQLAQTVKQGEVSVKDIDKNKGKFDESYMTDEFLQQMAGNTPIHSVPANISLTSNKYVDGSVRIDKIDNHTKTTVGIRSGDFKFKYHELTSGDLGSVQPTDANITRIVDEPVKNKGIIKKIKVIAGMTTDYVIKIFEKTGESSFRTVSRHKFNLHSGENVIITDIQVDKGMYVGYYSELGVFNTEETSSEFAYVIAGDVDADTTYSRTSQRMMLEAEVEILSVEKRTSHISPTEIEGVTKTSGTVNKFDKNSVIEGGYYRPLDGVWVEDSIYVSSNFIPVKYAHLYKKTDPATSYVLWGEGKYFISGSSHDEIISITDPNVNYITFAVKEVDLDITMFTLAKEYPNQYVSYQKEKYAFDESIVVDNKALKNALYINSKPFQFVDSGNYLFEPPASTFNQAGFTTVIRMDNKIDNPIDKFYMYWAGHDGGGIRLSTAPDPLGPWTHYPDEATPLLDDNYFGTSNHISSPHIVYDEVNAKFALFYHRAYQTPQIQSTWRAESDDGLTFTNPIEILPCPENGSWDGNERSYFRAILFNGTWYGVYQGRNAQGENKDHHAHIGFAMSDDGVNWNRLPHPLWYDNQFSDVGWTMDKFLGGSPSLLHYRGQLWCFWSDGSTGRKIVGAPIKDLDSRNVSPKIILTSPSWVTHNYGINSANFLSYENNLYMYYHDNNMDTNERKVGVAVMELGGSLNG